MNEEFEAALMRAGHQIEQLQHENHIQSAELVSCKETIQRLSAELEAARKLIGLQSAICGLIPAADGERANDSVIGRVERVVKERDALRAEISKLTADLLLAHGETGRALEKATELRARIAVRQREIERLRARIASLEATIAQPREQQ